MESRREVVENENRKENDEFGLGQVLVDADISELACMAFIGGMPGKGCQVDYESSKLSISLVLCPTGRGRTVKATQATFVTFSHSKKLSKSRPA
jgi:hypothetical protein